MATQPKAAPAKRILVVDDDRTLRHAVTRMLEADGFAISTAGDGAEGLDLLKKRRFDLVLLDVWMPHMTGLEVLAQLSAWKSRPRVIVMTSDNTPDTVLRAIRQHAFQYISKPCPPKEVAQAVKDALAADELPIEVISARPHWVELLVPCDRSVVERIQGFLMQLEADLPGNVRQNIAQAFRELLLNAIEWGGRLDATRKVRIAYLRARRMLLYRIADPGPGFRFEGLTHAAINNPAASPIDHVLVREQKGLRPGGFGILMTRQLVDELFYNEAQNEVVFVKYLD